MINHITLFYWSGWIFLTGLLSILGISLLILSAKALWWIVKAKDSAFRASAAMLCAYFYWAFKLRYNIDEARHSMRLGDYEITVEDLEGEASE